MNELYKSEWRLLLNLFLTSSKLIDKKRIGSKTIKKHDLPKTPYQRILDSAEVSNKDKNILREIYKQFNPFLLEEIIKKKIKNVLQFNFYRKHKRLLPDKVPVGNKGHLKPARQPACTGRSGGSDKSAYSESISSLGTDVSIKNLISHYPSKKY